jgi:hypothetical protein
LNRTASAHLERVAGRRVNTPPLGVRLRYNSPGLWCHNTDDVTIPKALFKQGPVVKYSGSKVAVRYMFLFDNLLVLTKPVRPPHPSFILSSFTLPLSASVCASSLFWCGFKACRL